MSLRTYVHTASAEQRPPPPRTTDDNDNNSIMSKLVATSLEQLSRMFWAANWARAEKAALAASEEASRQQQQQQQRKPRPLVDVRLNLVVGDAVDTCDAICLLSSEGLSAWGKARDGDKVRCGVG